jgi:hypothetical protein
MSSTYRVLCLSHDPAMVAADGDWNRASMAEEAIAAGVEGHEQCDLLIGRYSYPLVEVGCPATKDNPGPHRCIHGGTQWADVDWLRLLAIAQREPSDTELGRAAEEAGRRCWSPERLRRLGPELGVGPQPVAGVDLCGHPGPAADDPSNPCTLPLSHDMHRDQDGCSWPTPEPAPLTRTAVRAVVKFMSGVHGGVDGQYIERLTDDVWAKVGAAETAEQSVDVPGPERARILKQARAHLREYRKALSADGDYECGVKDGMLEASWHLTALGRVGDDEFWAASSTTVEVIGRAGGAS